MEQFLYLSWSQNQSGLAEISLEKAETLKFQIGNSPDKERVVDQGLHEQVRREESFKAHQVTLAELAGKSKLKAQKSEAARIDFGFDFSDYRSW